MKITIKATISIIAITLAGMSIAQAGDNRHEREHNRENDRGYSRNIEKPHHDRQFRKHKKRQHSKRAHRAQHQHDRYRAKRHLKEYQRIRKNHSKWRRGNYHVTRPVYHGSYIAPGYSSARVSVSTHINGNNALPTIAGGLIGSAIANDISHGDAGATFGGAIFGAVIGNAIAHH